MEAVTVRDNGHGIPYSEVQEHFGQLGGSWKAHGNRSKTKFRMLHGKEGRGRFKALALGRVSDWTIVFEEKGQRFRYPYTEEPHTSIEEAERKVFDIVALNINKQLPAFSEADHRTKAFQLRMLRQGRMRTLHRRCA